MCVITKQELIKLIESIQAHLVNVTKNEHEKIL